MSIPKVTDEQVGLLRSNYKAMSKSYENFPSGERVLLQHLKNLIEKGGTLARLGRYCKEHFDILEDEDMEAIELFESLQEGGVHRPCDTP